MSLLAARDTAGRLTPDGSTMRVRVIALSDDLTFCVTQDADKKPVIDAGEVLAFDRRTADETDVEVFPWPRWWLPARDLRIAQV